VLDYLADELGRGLMSREVHQGFVVVKVVEDEVEVVVLEAHL
jgi:hypothetical protein